MRPCPTRARRDATTEAAALAAQWAARSGLEPTLQPGKAERQRIGAAHDTAAKLPIRTIQACRPPAGRGPGGRAGRRGAGHGRAAVRGRGARRRGPAGAAGVEPRGRRPVRGPVLQPAPGPGAGAPLRRQPGPCSRRVQGPLRSTRTAHTPASNLRRTALHGCPQLLCGTSLSKVSAV